MKLNEIERILIDLGFKNDGEQYLDDTLIMSFYNKDKENITVETFYTPEFREYLDSLPEGIIEFEPNKEQCEVVAINIDTDKFAYPEGRYSLDREWEGGIRISINDYYLNFQSLSLENFKKALWMVKNPIQAKFQITRNFIKEVELFYSKYKELIEKLNLKELENSILLVGKTINETEPYIEYTYKHRFVRFYFNIFTNKLVFDQRYDKCRYRQLNVNDLTPEELEHELNLF